MAARRRLAGRQLHESVGTTDLSARLCSALLCTLTGVRSPVAPMGRTGVLAGLPGAAVWRPAKAPARRARRAVATGSYTGEQGCSREQ